MKKSLFITGLDGFVGQYFQSHSNAQVAAWEMLPAGQFDWHLPKLAFLRAMTGAASAAAGIRDRRVVSHDRSAIQSICDSATLLEGGCMAMHDKPEAVMDYYNALLAEREGQTVRQEMLEGGQVRTVPGTGEAGILSVRLLDERKRSIVAAEVGQSVELEVQVEIRQDIQRLVLGFMIKDRLGQPMYGINTHRQNQALEQLHAGERITYLFAFTMGLGKGNYSIALSLSRLDSHLDRNFEWRDYGLVFHVINNRQENFVGCSWLGAKTSITRNAEPVLTEEAP